MSPPAEARRICISCRQELPPELNGALSASAETELPADESDIPQEIAAIGSRELRTDKYRVVTGDLARAEQLRELARVEAENRRPGANLCVEAIVAASHPQLRDWLQKSDRLADPKEIKGRSDLVKQRRLGILRHLEGEDRGFPLGQPVPTHHLPQGQGFWLLRLRDELEWLSMPVLKPTPSRPYPRPVKDRLNHREARAILDWKASRLDMWLADRPHLIGGRLAVDSSRGVLFDTDAFVRWVYALMN